MKPRLLILSDLFGGENPEWIKYYTELLESKFDIQYYDLQKLGEIEASDFDEKNIHNQFLKTGIDKGVQNLLNLEKEKVTVLGFSIGGTIAWKASIKGLNISQLIAVSSTRLRFETDIPNCKIKLYFGGKDLNLPDLQWFFDLQISNQFFENQDHQLYLEEKNALVICNDILKGFD
jgi:hypothetical protein